MPVIIGVDPHKHSHTLAALDEHGRLLDRQRFPATLEGYQALRGWAERWDQRGWAVEGAGGVGRALAQWLVADAEPVVDVPAKLATRVRVLSTGHGRKTDPDDAAVSVAVAARSAASLRQVGVEDQAVVLHLLTNRREDLVRMRTQTSNRLHRLLADLAPAGAARTLTADGAAVLLDQVCPTGAPAVTRWQLASDLIADVRDLDRRIATVEECIQTAVKHSKTSLVELFGVGPVLAAKLLGEVGDIGRFPSKHHFAAHTGTAPLAASSGQVVRHRLSRAGDRKLSHALYLMAIVQIRHPTAGQAYYRRKRAEGKSAKEALRCLKRRLSDAVYRCLLADQPSL
ncbi:MAG TPA: IS110 family transposase [Actinomycetes bacterium]|nr:IS110 family transposase [Actinomycetes bacterium]